MRLQADWLSHPGTLRVLNALEDAGHGAWFVGGCVRNGLLGTPVDDIDICTDALPERVVTLSEEAGLKAVPTGIDHGTITVVANGKPHEITTLRRDVSTDGRRATVAFSERLEEDAARRDFTMNALYATRSGEVLDPNGEGLIDLEARRLRFIGDADARIREDYLRILRFFRFHAWYADPEGGMDPDGLAACAAHVEGLDRLSAERVGAELRKLLSAPDPAPAVAAMEHAGVLTAILPGATARMLPILIAVSNGLPSNPIPRLVVIGGEEVPERLRLSKVEAKAYALYREEMISPKGPEELGYRFGEVQAKDILAIRGAMEGRSPGTVDYDRAKTGAMAVFPVKPSDLMPAFEGPELGSKLAELERRWIDSRFELTKDNLLRS